MSGSTRSHRARPWAAAAWTLLALAGSVASPTRAAASALPPDSCAYRYVVRWTTLPDKDQVQGSAYTAWTRKALPRALMVAGVTELATYRAAAGGPHIVTAFSFPSLASLAAWRGAREIEELHAQAHEFTYEVTTEVWGPSPDVPTPVAVPGRAASDSGHVLYVASWNPYPRKLEAYRRWVPDAARRWAAGPEVLAVRAYRELSGAHAEVFTYEFPSLEAWARWYQSEDMQRTRVESRELVVDARTELWGPNPMLPVPIVAREVRERLGR